VITKSFLWRVWVEKCSSGKGVEWLKGSLQTVLNDLGLTNWSLVVVREDNERDALGREDFIAFIVDLLKYFMCGWQFTSVTLYPSYSPVWPQFNKAVVSRNIWFVKDLWAPPHELFTSCCSNSTSNLPYWKSYVLPNQLDPEQGFTFRGRWELLSTEILLSSLGEN
jgi:hypothetical protein